VIYPEFFFAYQKNDNTENGAIFLGIQLFSSESHYGGKIRHIPEFALILSFKSSKF